MKTKNTQLGWLRSLRSLAMATAFFFIGGTAMAQSPQHVTIGGSVFGGGNLANVGGNCTVLVDQADASIGTDVYGGGALAQANTLGGDTPNPGKSTTVTIKQGTVAGNVYGGGLGERPAGEDPGTAADVFGPVQVTVNGGTVTGSVFGCNNLYGAPQDTVIVNITQTATAMTVHNVYGGGNLADYKAPFVSGTSGPRKNLPQVNINHGTVSGSVFGGGYGATAEVDGNPQVTIGDNNSGHTATVNGNVYGGGDLAAVTGSPYIKVWNTNSTVAHEVYGGGNQADVSNSTTVDIIEGTISENVYGGGALANVGTSASDQTTVNILGGTVTGNVYGGGLGCKTVEDDPETPEDESVAAVAAVVNGVVTVNIGALTGALDVNGFAPSASVTGSATIGGSVFGCNNANGTPKDNVFVNIYKTAHIDGTNTTADEGYALYQVFGGGNQAHYQPASTGKKTTVHIWTCDNTIQYLYGGGNAANVGTSGTNSATDVVIDGGRIEWVFGGGNGASTPTFTNPGADIYGNVQVDFHSGVLHYIFGGSNEKGNVSGIKTVNIATDGPCDKEIVELYGGSNKAPTTGDVIFTMGCDPSLPDDFKIDYLFGGSRMADITGNVTLTVEGGKYDYVFGGNNISGNITGNVTLNLNGGTINEAAFGGNKGGGTISGNITVNVEDKGLVCPLDVQDVFGAGDQAEYTAPSGESAQENNPIVYVKHLRENHPITGNVYGGGNGDPDDSSQEPGMVTGNPKVIIGDLEAGHGSYCAAISGNVYGGGNAAKVVGTTTVLMQKANSTVGSDIYGGGNLANVSGATDVDITGGTVTQDVYGGGALANTGGSDVTLDGGTVRDLYGGGLGRITPTPAIAAQVTGPVQVTVNGGTVTGSVYGCNNLNGAPQSTVNVDVYGTDMPASGYALGKVFGGGNQANFNGTPIVKVHNCTNKIEYVYGGGNAANVAATDVTIYGGNTIGNVFGGCYGANVTGSTNVKIYGGTIGKVFGGNDQSGTIGGTLGVTIDKQAEGEDEPCDMHITEVYSGGNLAGSNAGNITVNCTGGVGEGIEYLYGGANDADVTGPITLNVIDGRIQNVFGGNNTGHSVNGAITVNINKETNPCGWEIGNVFGGGNHAAYNGVPDVNIINGEVSGSVYGGGSEAGVKGGDVVMTGGTVLGSIYGGCNTSGTVDGPITVEVKGGTMGSAVRLAAGTLSNVFGGGYGEGTSTTGNVTVTVTKATGDDAPAAPTIYGDVYGGSALGTVNNDANDETTVSILDGILETHEITEAGFPAYIGGNVYGGGLGEAGDGNVGKGQVNGKVFVNIGSGVMDTEDPRFTSSTSGNATIKGNIYGCNNTNGSPQQNVVVNIYQTAHTVGVDDINSNGYALKNVFGGGNKAKFQVSGKTATVNVFSCENTISRTFGGSNAAASNSVFTMIQGGHIQEAYGGGNGEVTPADVNGDVTLDIHGGSVDQSFGGSNQQGTISGTSDVSIDSEGGCGESIIEEFYCGGNFANYYGDIDATIKCADGLHIENLYGGCKQADVLPSGDKIGNVHLVVNGGTYENIFGGSQGRKAGTNGPDDPGESADISGHVLLEVHGATVTNAIFGGSHILGSIAGTITINIEDDPAVDCPLDLSNADVYGGGNEADYHYAQTKYPADQDKAKDYPKIYIKNATVKNVFGGGYNAEVTGNPQIYLKNKAKVLGNVYGGGNMGEVDGNPNVIVDGNDTTPNPTDFPAITLPDD